MDWSQIVVDEDVVDVYVKLVVILKVFSVKAERKSGIFLFRAKTCTRRRTRQIGLRHLQRENNTKNYL